MFRCCSMPPCGLPTKAICDAIRLRFLIAAGIYVNTYDGNVASRNYRSCNKGRWNGLGLLITYLPVPRAAIHVPRFGHSARLWAVLISNHALRSVGFDTIVRGYWGIALEAVIWVEARPKWSQPETWGMNSHRLKDHITPLPKHWILR